MNEKTMEKFTGTTYRDISGYKCGVPFVLTQQHDCNVSVILVLFQL